MNADAEVSLDNPRDECACGDWREDHPNNGPCRFNGRGFDMCHGGKDCMSFRLVGRAGWRDTQS